MSARRARCLQRRVGVHDRIFVLTGAGISAESGLVTFRDGQGLWERHRVEEVATVAAWRQDPELVWRFYGARREQAARALPNAAHRELARLQRRLGDRLFLCTQNVDDLHERAGSPAVHHMHGCLTQSRCEVADSLDGGNRYGCPCDRAGPHRDDLAYSRLDEVPRCERGYRWRPHICWFGETPFAMDAILAALDRCTVFVTVGSSGSVYPAAGFVRHLAGSRCSTRRVYVGPEPPDNRDAFTEILLGTATEVLPELCAQID